jgi:effector-binding domain-containing protein
MVTEPKIEFFEAQPYVAIRQKVSMAEIPTVLPPLISEVFIWMGANNVEGNGAPFFRYLTMDEDKNMLVDVGIPTNSSVSGSEKIIAKEFPAGNYATLTFTGDYKNLRQGHMALEDWLKENQYKETGTMEDGEWLGARIELYISDPSMETDPEKWETEIRLMVEKSA